MAFIILKPKETVFYGQIKNFMTNHLFLPCQCVQSKSILGGKNVASIASKIAIQMSCKAGDAPWIV